MTAPPSSARGPLARFDEHPRSSVVVAAFGLAFTAILFALSESSPTTATLFRAIYALPFLWLIARREERAAGPRPWRARRWAFIAGIFFGIDLILFHHSILLMGAGLASVLSNLQVVFVLIAAWILWGERPTTAQAAGVPLALFGIVLISGVLGGETFGSDPVLGSILGVFVGLTYAAYLLLLRRGRDRTHAAGPIFDATLGTAATGLVIGLVAGDLELIPTWPGHIWLLVLALSAQVVGGALLAVALPRLPALTTSLLLLIQPVLAVAFAMVLLDEAPSFMQLAGVAAVIGGVTLGALPSRSRADPPSAPPSPISAGP